MKRFRRILFNTLTVISLLLALATAGLWVRSASRYEALRYDGTLGQIGFSSSGYSHGLRFVYVESHVNAAAPGWTLESREDSSGPSRTTWWKSGFDFKSMPLPGGRASLLIGVPHWLPMAVFGIAPAVRLRQRFRAAYARGELHCPACGYDMRANPARCSECGHEPKPAAT